MKELKIILEANILHLEEVVSTLEPFKTQGKNKQYIQYKAKLDAYKEIQKNIFELEKK